MSKWDGNFAAIVTKTCHCSAERGNDIQISISEFSQSKVFEHENSISLSLSVSISNQFHFEPFDTFYIRVKSIFTDSLKTIPIPLFTFYSLSLSV